MAVTAAARLAVAALCAGMALTACRADADDEPLFPGPPEATITLDEYRIDAPEQLPSGRVLFEVANAGEVAHSLSVVPLPDDYPETFEEAYADEDSPQARPTVFVLGARPPGETHRFALDLEPGRYGLLCTLTDDDGVTHARKGMATQIRVE